jgi:hypothetical protein
MNIRLKEMAKYFAIAVLLLTAACGTRTDTPETTEETQPATPVAVAATPVPTPEIPNLQNEIGDQRFRETTSPLGNFDFKNFTYPLPRGWQNPDGADITLVDGRVVPVSLAVNENMSDEERIERKSARRIGMSFVTVKYFDMTGDGNDEAIVVLKIETAGNAIPQVVYIYEWKDDKPELIWNFRTGDRADGGLKDIRPDNGEFTIELFGQDRFILGEVETGKVTGDEEQLCCPTYFTRSFYKWNGSTFLREGKRFTYELANQSAPPLENYGDIVNARENKKK